jgi:hypothetical protein
LQLSSQGKFASFDNFVNVSIICRAFILSEIGKSLFGLRDVGQHSTEDGE